MKIGHCVCGRNRLNIPFTLLQLGGATATNPMKRVWKWHVSQLPQGKLQVGFSILFLYWQLRKACAPGEQLEDAEPLSGWFSD